MDMLFVLLLGLFLFAPLGGWIASQKGRSIWEGALLGGLIGLFGVIVELALPSKRDY